MQHPGAHHKAKALYSGGYLLLVCHRSSRQTVVKNCPEPLIGNESDIVKRIIAAAQFFEHANGRGISQSEGLVCIRNG